ncbi:MAG: DNA repair protein RecO [Waddliaceae bacterium]
MPESLRTEGIILHTLDFQDYDQILTVFSIDQGIVKFFLQGTRNSRHKKGIGTTPLTVGEYIYRKGKSDLFYCREISVINQHLGLRKNLAALETACDLIQTVQKSQFPGKPAPALYQLLVRYLDSIPLFSSPEILGASFRLKLLRHDGHLGITSQCSACGTPLSALYLVRGESFCKEHATGNVYFFSEEEADLLNRLAYCRTISELYLPLPPAFNKRIKELFTEVILLA